MKKSIKWIAGAIVTAALFASCGSKNPVAGNKTALNSRMTADATGARLS